MSLTISTGERAFGLLKIIKNYLYLRLDKRSLTFSCKEFTILLIERDLTRTVV